MKRVLLVLALVLFGADFAYGQTAQAYINGAKARMSKNKWQDARQVLAEHIDDYPDNAEMHYLYAVTLSKVSPDSNPKAIEHLAKADELNGDPGPENELQADIDQAMKALWAPMVNDGIRLLSAGQLDEAEAKLSLAAEINPEGKESHLALGAVQQARKNYDAAIEHYRKAVEVDPAYKQALIRLGATYQLMAEELAAAGNATRATEVAGQAAQVYEDYLAENPGDVEVQAQLAGLYASLGQMEKAEPVIQSLLASDSLDAGVYTDFGFRLANAEQDELAERVLEKAVVMTDSLHTEPLDYLAFVRIRQKDLEGAKVVLEKQVEIDPSNAQAWEYLGYVRRDLGDETGAQEAFGKAEAIPVDLENVTMTQDPDGTWNAEATFKNRKETPVQDVRVKFHLVSADGLVVDTQEVSLTGEPLPAGQAASVRVEFTKQAANPRIRYEIL